MAKYIYKCPFCDNKYIAVDKQKQPDAKKALYEHMDKEHQDQLKALSGISPAQAYFNLKYGKTHGNCVMCKKPTEWNESVERYNRFCSDKCKDAYCKQFKARMKQKYGKEHLLNDPNQQKKMLSHRSISGTYTWHDGSGKLSYVGSYEHEFLEFLDLVMNLECKDVMAPAPQVFKYKYKEKEHFYIPDFYIVSLNLLVEIKDGGDNPNMHHKIQDVDKVKEELKDEAMAKQKQFDYIKVTDKDYSIFLNHLIARKYET